MMTSRFFQTKYDYPKAQLGARGGMQFQVDAGDARPTFFELVAADRLVPSLRAALVYSLGVLVQRRPSLARVLDFEDEAFALFMLLAEAHSFATSDGSVAEGLYGLQRTRLTPRPRPASRATDGTLRAAVTALSLASGVPDAGRERRRALGITRRQRLASVAMLVALPYARDKLDKLYARLAASRGVAIGGEAALAAAVLGPANPPRDRARPADEDPAQAASPNRGAPARTTHRIAEDAFVRLYPWFHAACEGAVFVYWLRYLLGGGDCHDPSLRVARLRVSRVSPAEAAERRAELEAARAAAIAAAARSPSILTRAVRPAALRASHFTADYAQGGLVLAAVGFKLVEWWYGTAEERLGGGGTLPVPPPPPKPRPHPDGVGVPAEPGACPLCGVAPMASPAMVVASGYVFCHACVEAHVSRRGTCPVTLARAAPGNIRKLFSE
jgi:peroxin-12